MFHPNQLDYWPTPKKSTNDILVSPLQKTPPTISSIVKKRLKIAYIAGVHLFEKMDHIFLLIMSVMSTERGTSRPVNHFGPRSNVIIKTNAHADYTQPTDGCPNPEYALTYLLSI